MAKVGRPTDYRKDYHPEDFITQSRRGKTFAQIAALWNIDRSTLFRWEKKHPEFRTAVKIGRELAEAWYIELGQAAMVNRAKIDGQIAKVDLGWFVWLTKNMFKWNDRQSHEHSGPDGNPIETVNKHSDLTDAELNAKIEKLKEKLSAEKKEQS
jgi:hypothetical protein